MKLADAQKLSRETTANFSSWVAERTKNPGSIALADLNKNVQLYAQTFERLQECANSAITALVVQKTTGSFFGSSAALDKLQKAIAGTKATQPKEVSYFIHECQHFHDSCLAPYYALSQAISSGSLDPRILPLFQKTLSAFKMELDKWLKAHHTLQRDYLDVVEGIEAGEKGPTIIVTPGKAMTVAEEPSAAPEAAPVVAAVAIDLTKPFPALFSVVQISFKRTSLTFDEWFQALASSTDLDAETVTQMLGAISSAVNAALHCAQTGLKYFRIQQAAVVKQATLEIAATASPEQLMALFGETLEFIAEFSGKIPVLAERAKVLCSQQARSDQVLFATAIQAFMSKLQTWGEGVELLGKELKATPMQNGVKKSAATQAPTGGEDGLPDELPAVQALWLATKGSLNEWLSELEGSQESVAASQIQEMLTTLQQIQVSFFTMAEVCLQDVMAAVDAEEVPDMASLLAARQYLEGFNDDCQNFHGKLLARESQVKLTRDVIGALQACETFLKDNQGKLKEFLKKEKKVRQGVSSRQSHGITFETKKAQLQELREGAQVGFAELVNGLESVDQINMEAWVGEFNRLKATFLAHAHTCELPGIQVAQVLEIAGLANKFTRFCGQWSSQLMGEALPLLTAARSEANPRNIPEILLIEGFVTVLEAWPGALSAITAKAERHFSKAEVAVGKASQVVEDMRRKAELQTLRAQLAAKVATAPEKPAKVSVITILRVEDAEAALAEHQAGASDQAGVAVLTLVWAGCFDLIETKIKALQLGVAEAEKGEARTSSELEVDLEVADAAAKPLTQLRDDALRLCELVIKSAKELPKCSREENKKRAPTVKASIQLFPGLQKQLKPYKAPHPIIDPKAFVGSQAGAEQARADLESELDDEASAAEQKRQRRGLKIAARVAAKAAAKAAAEQEAVERKVVSADIMTLILKLSDTAVEHSMLRSCFESGITLFQRDSTSVLKADEWRQQANIPELEKAHNVTFDECLQNARSNLIVQGVNLTMMLQTVQDWQNSSAVVGQVHAYWWLTWSVAEHLEQAAKPDNQMLCDTLRIQQKTLEELLSGTVDLRVMPRLA